jgi:hypothetical protein
MHVPIDATRVLAAPPRTQELTWRPDDVLLYHLALGAGVAPTDPAVAERDAAPALTAELTTGAAA